MKRFVLLFVLISLLVMATRYSVRVAVYSKIKYKQELVYNLSKVRPAKKVDQYYLFFENLEISKYNAWLAKIQYLNTTLFDTFIPDQITNEIPYNP